MMISLDVIATLEKDDNKLQHEIDPFIVEHMKYVLYSINTKIIQI
jgi:hypothetical protein